MLDFKNFKKGPMTSLLGIIIILASVVSVFVKELEMSWTEAVVGMMVGTTLLGVKDPKNTNKDDI